MRLDDARGVSLRCIRAPLRVNLESGVSFSSPSSTALKEMLERRLVSGAGSIKGTSGAGSCFTALFGDFDVDRRRLGERGASSANGAIRPHNSTLPSCGAIHLMASNASSPAKEMDRLRAVLGRTANLFSGALSALFAGDFGVTFSTSSPLGVDVAFDFGDLSGDALRGVFPPFSRKGDRTTTTLSTLCSKTNVASSSLVN